MEYSFAAPETKLQLCFRAAHKSLIYEIALTSPPTSDIRHKVRFRWIRSRVSSGGYELADRLESACGVITSVMSAVAALNQTYSRPLVW